MYVPPMVNKYVFVPDPLVDKVDVDIVTSSYISPRNISPLYIPLSDQTQAVEGI